MKILLPCKIHFQKFIPPLSRRVAEVSDTTPGDAPVGIGRLRLRVYYT